MTYQIEIGAGLINLVKARIAHIQNTEDTEYFEKLDELDRKIAREIIYEITVQLLGSQCANCGDSFDLDHSFSAYICDFCHLQICGDN